MSVWDEIDALKRKFDRELESATNGCEAEGAIKGSVHVDDLNRWCCRFIPKGERKHEVAHAKTGPELVDAMKAIRAHEQKKGKA